MTNIAPQALTVEINAAPAGARLGVAVIGFGGFGVAVADALNNRFSGQADGFGLHLLYADAVRADGYSPPCGPYALGFSEADARFLLNTEDFGSVLRAIEQGQGPEWAPPITPAEARDLREAKVPRAVGFGGQPVPSAIAARLAYATWEERIDSCIRAAAAESPDSEPLIALVGSFYGGMGIGHLPVLLDRLRAAGHENIAVFAALPSQAAGILPPAQVPEAMARGVAVLRGLVRPGLFRHLFLLGTGNGSHSRNPRSAAVQVAASVLASWVENPSAFRSEQAGWLGADSQGATTAERLSALGAAEVVFPEHTLGRQQAAQTAARALQLLEEISPVVLHRATDDGVAFAWSDPLTRDLSEVTTAPPGTSAVAVFDSGLVHGQLRKTCAWWSTALPDEEPMEHQSVTTVMDGLARRVTDGDLVLAGNAWLRDETAGLTRATQRARALHLARYRAAVGDRVAEQLGGPEGVNLGERPDAVRRCVEYAGAAARVLADTATRIRGDLDRVREELDPIRLARRRLEESEARLLPVMKVRGHRSSPELLAYLDALSGLLDVTMLDLELGALADHLDVLADVCREAVRPLGALLDELREHRLASLTLAGEFGRYLEHLDAQPTMVVVPATPGGRAALTDELARVAAGDVTPDLAQALLTRIRLHWERPVPAEPGRPVLQLPPVRGFTAAAEERRTAVSRATGSLAADGKTGLLAASFMPMLAYQALAPQYARCTLFDALAADYARGWAADQGGHADDDLVRDYLDVRVVSPMLRAGATTVEVAGEAEGVQPVERRAVNLDQRSPRNLQCVAPDTAERVGRVLTAMLAEAGVRVSDGAPGRATMTTVVNRLPWRRVVELNGRVVDHYHGCTRPVHLDAGVRRAHAIERQARELGLLRSRTLDPDVVLLLDDPEALRAFLGLLATGRMPVRAGDLLSEESDVYQVDVAAAGGRFRVPEWRPLGPVTDPLGTLWELFHGDDGPRLRRAVVETWKREQAKLVADCGDAERAREMVRLALRELQLPAGGTTQRFAEDVALLTRVDTL